MMERIGRLETLARGKSNLRVECRCGHVGVVDVQQAARWFLMQRWDTEIGDPVRRRLRCSRCGGRPGRFSATREVADAPNRFPRDEAGWKAKIRRLRD